MYKKYYLKNGDCVTRKHLLAILNWCKKTLGRSKYFSIRALQIKFKSNLEFFIGIFDVEKNCIYVNPTGNENVLDFITTIIHEYVHFQQDFSKYEEIELKLPRKRNYYDHPYEKEAETKAQKLKRACFKDLKKEFNW